MVDPDTGVEGEEPISQPNVGMTKIVLNGQEVEVPDVPEVIESLKSTEHNLKSGYDKKLQAERAALQAEREQQKTFLDEDTTWYAQHSKEEWPHYKPKVYYGEQGGYDGSTQPTQTTQQKKVANMDTFDVDPMVKIKELEAKITAIEKDRVYDEEAAKAAVNSTLTDAQKEYKNADVDSVIKALEVNYLKTGRHATPAQVVAEMKRSHEHVMKFIKTETRPAAGVVGPGRSATPTATGTPPSAPAPEKKKIGLGDFDAILSEYSEFKKG